MLREEADLFGDSFSGNQKLDAPVYASSDASSGVFPANSVVHRFGYAVPEEVSLLCSHVGHQRLFFVQFQFEVVPEILADFRFDCHSPVPSSDNRAKKLASVTHIFDVVILRITGQFAWSAVHLPAVFPDVDDISFFLCFLQEARDAGVWRVDSPFPTTVGIDAFSQRFHEPVQLMKVDICQNWTDQSALRAAGHVLIERRVFHVAS